MKKIQKFFLRHLDQETRGDARAQRRWVEAAWHSIRLNIENLTADTRRSFSEIFIRFGRDDLAQQLNQPHIIAKGYLKKPILTDILGSEQILVSDIRTSIVAAREQIFRNWEQLFRDLPLEYQKLLAETAVQERRLGQQVTLPGIIIEWIIQKVILEEIVDFYNLVKVNEFSHNSSGGAVLLTESGSIIAIGAPDDENVREYSYIRVPSRNSATQRFNSHIRSTTLDEEILVGKRASLGSANIQISKVLDIYQMPDSISPETLSQIFLVLNAVIARTIR